MVGRTIRAIKREATRILEEHGIENAAFESGEIVSNAFDKNSAWLITHADAIASEKRVAVIEDCIRRRCAGEPLQYVLGLWEFYSYKIWTGKGVLVPRQDTELLVDKALEFLEGRANPRVLDLCSGSGCITVAIAKKKSGCDITAVEWYDDAKKYLDYNLYYHRLHRSVKSVKADVLAQPSGVEGKFDLIVSNPPYIRSNELDSLSREVKSEPETALDGGADGCDFYRSIAVNWAPMLSSDGRILVEIGFDLAKEVSDIFEQAGFTTEVFKDICSNDRVVCATKKVIKRER